MGNIFAMIKYLVIVQLLLCDKNFIARQWKRRVRVELLSNRREILSLSFVFGVNCVVRQIADNLRRFYYQSRLPFESSLFVVSFLMSDIICGAQVLLGHFVICFSTCYSLPPPPLRQLPPFLLWYGLKHHVRHFLNNSTRDSVFFFTLLALETHSTRIRFYLLCPAIQFNVLQFI